MSSDEGSWRVGNCPYADDEKSFRRAQAQGLLLDEPLERSIARHPCKWTPKAQKSDDFNIVFQTLRQKDRGQKTICFLFILTDSFRLLVALIDF